LIGQIDSEYTAFIYNKIRALQHEGTIYYADRPEIIKLSELKEDLKPHSFKSRLKNFPDTVLKLTHKEKEYIILEWKRSFKNSFPDNLFPNSICLNFYSLIRKVDSLNIQRMDSLRKLRVANPQEKIVLGVRRLWSFGFSRPIYLRRKSIMCCYFMYYSLSGGEEDLAFYRHKDGKWIRGIVFGGGAW
jgi:hypothetical protein